MWGLEEGQPRTELSGSWKSPSKGLGRCLTSKGSGPSPAARDAGKSPSTLQVTRRPSALSPAQVRKGGPGRGRSARSASSHAPPGRLWPSSWLAGAEVAPWKPRHRRPILILADILSEVNQHPPPSPLATELGVLAERGAGSGTSCCADQAKPVEELPTPGGTPVPSTP